MNKASGEIIARIKKSLKGFADTIEKEPLILIDARGKHWLNDNAKQFLSKKEIQIDDFMEWLKIGSSHLQKLTYSDIHIHMVRLPGSDVIALLKQESEKRCSEKFSLTLKEKEILRCLVKGFSNKAIADIMKVSPGTVNSHLDNIYQKLDCSNRLEASFLALKNGLYLPTRKIQAKKKIP